MEPPGALARNGPLVVPVSDVDDRPVTTGMVLFCPEAAPCLEFPVSPDGTIELDLALLQPDSAYTVLVYADDLSVRFATYGWTYGDPPPDGDATPRLRGLPAEQLAVVLPLPAGEPHGDLAVPFDGPDLPAEAFPRLLGGITVPFMLGGNFGTSSDALTGVTDVSPGFGVVGLYRFGYPVRRNLGRSSVSFREVSLAYAQNRYETDPVQPTGSGSDLTFHRFTASFGLGRLWDRTQGSVSVAAGYGGVYDGTELLEFRGRSYGMFGLGLQGRFVWRAVGGDGRLAAGLLAQLEMMYYFADASSDDHWYGWAPSLAVGLIVF
jgi:hypothetical protein